MGEKGTTHTRVAAAFITRAAKEKGRLQEVAQGLTDAHELNASGKGHKPFDVLDSQTRALVVDELEKLDPAAKKHLGKSGGYVNLTSSEADPVIQSLAERVDHLVSGILRRWLPEERRKRVLQEIQDEIIKRNNW